MQKLLICLMTNSRTTSQSPSQAMEVAESLMKESMALQSHLLWLTSRLIALTKRFKQPNLRATIQPIFAKELKH